MLLTAAPASAQVVSLESIAANKAGDALAAGFGVSLAGADEIAETLRNGVPLRLQCRASISLKRRYFFDTTLGEGGLVADLQYDALTKEYILMKPGPEKPVRNTDLAALLKEGWKSFSIPLCQWDMLQRGTTYELVVEASLLPQDVPDWFTRTFLFWSWQGGPSATSTLEFRY